MSCYTHKWRLYRDYRLCDVTSTYALRCCLSNNNIYNRQLGVFSADDENYRSTAAGSARGASTCRRHDEVARRRGTQLDRQLMSVSATCRAACVQASTTHCTATLAVTRWRRLRCRTVRAAAAACVRLAETVPM